MRKTRGRPVAAVVSVLVIGSMLGGTAAAEPLSGRSADGRVDPAKPTSAAGVSGQVTLITGDRVTVRGARPAEVRPGKGREKVSFIQRKEVNGDLTVLPLDALNAVRSGELDPRLFNVTKLIQHGFDDRSRTDIPLIVSGPAGLRSGVAQARNLPSVGGAAVRVGKSSAYWQRALPTLRAKGTQWIRLDGPVRALLDKSVPQIGAPAAWRSGFTGQGTEVAVLDSGIDAAHPDLDDAVVAAKDFTESESGTADKFGHGTHVASIVTGDHPQYRGVAPDAKLLNGKVLGDDGSGSESGIIAGMEWATQAGAEVVNLSLGSDFPSDGKDLLSEAVNRLTEQTGALFVISSGNSGGAPGSPGAADAALTVGAIDRDENLAEFSSRGPRWLDDAIKPDITAPGVDIVAAKAKDSSLAEQAPNVGEHHLRLSGTSMSAPHTAGAAALVAQQHPDWKADDLKAALMGTAKPNPALTVFEQGAGRVDVAAAVASMVRATPASLSLGVVRWPHHDDKPIAREVTYHNSGSTPLRLEPVVEGRGPDGTPAPAGMFTVSPTSLTVPAGGKATATVTTNTAVPGTDGIYSGVVVAGGIRTPIAVTREVESYDVKLTFLGYDGQPTPNYWFRFVDIDRPEAVIPGEDAGGTTTARLAAGQHYFEALVGNDDQTRLTYSGEPTIRVDGELALTIDARSGVPIGFEVDKPNAITERADYGMWRDTAWGGDEAVGFGVGGLNYDGVLVAPSRTTAAPDEFRFMTRAHLAAPSNSSYLYQLARDEPGKIPSRLFHRVRDTSLARVRSHYVGSKPGTYGAREDLPVKALPFTLDEFYTPGMRWYPTFRETDDPASFGFASQRTGPARIYQRGETVTERWNLPVFGPALPEYDSDPAAWAGRLGDEMRFSVPLYTDQRSGGFGSATSTGKTVLTSDGQEIASSPYSGSLSAELLPAGRRSFHLHTEADRDHPLSSRIVADWTFHSDTVAGATPAALPLLAVRFAPPARPSVNRPTVLPLAVEHNLRRPARVRTLAVSHDGGTTWKPAVLRTAAGKTFTVIKHPAGAQSVSLKATAADAAGNAVDQTIINAFRLK